MSEKLSVEKLINLLQQGDSLSSQKKADLKKRFESLDSLTGTRVGKVSKRRLQKKAAYKLASKDISKWQDTVNINRQVSQLDLQPANQAPASLQSLIKDSNKNQMQIEIQQLEGEEPQTIDIQPTTKRSNRSQMFYMLLKQKRIARIKSKLYHKIKKKQKMRNMSLNEQERAQKQELARIQERLTQKHSKYSKFKKNLLKYCKRQHNKASEALNQNQALRKRIMNPSKVTDGKVNFESSSQQDQEFLAQQLKQEIQTLPSKGVYAMKFMQPPAKRPEGESSQNSKFKFKGEPVKKRKINPKQEEYVREAFEQDEMDQVAAEEWDQIQAQEREKQPKFKRGWGAWTGVNIKHPQMVPVPLKYITEKTIVNTQRDKRAQKFMVKSHSYPYSSDAQYNAVHNIPIGKEWNSLKVYQEQISPEVVLPHSQMIHPISLQNTPNSYK